MNLRSVLLVGVSALVLAGCGIDPRDIGREPHMTPLGTGLETPVALYSNHRGPPPPASDHGSLWVEGAGSLYRDPRASRIGDVLTINIAINDKATLGNTTGRSTDNEIKNSFDASLDSFKIAGAGDTTSKSSSTGQGNIDRSEKIQLSVAAVVIDVLPSGNLVVSGSQEVRVNHEVRVLNVAGIVRPRDLSKENTIAYDKIAEARISYGGRGRLTEVQQPNWGQQIYDVIKPF